MDAGLAGADIEAALAEGDPSARIPYITSIQDQLLEGGGMVGLVTFQPVFAATDRVQGWTLWPTGNWNSAIVSVTE
jgi:ABC-type transport system substrate-binding protein